MDRKLEQRRFDKLLSGRIIGALVLREMASTYGKSAGGFLWVILEPIAGIALMTWIFSLAFRSPPLGDNFPMFYATGIIPFLMFFEVSNKVAQTIKFSRQLLAYPIITYLEAILARFILNGITQIFVAYLLLFGIALAFSPPDQLDYGALVLGVFLTLICALAVGTMNCFLFNMFPVWERIWAILMRPMFIISTIFFLFDDVPEPYAQFLWINPIIHFVGLFRKGIYSTYDAEFSSPLYVLLLSVTLLVVATTFLNRYYIEFRS